MFFEFVFLFISYFIGAIPTGFWFCKVFFNIDITKHGSKNIGATNVARVLGSKKYFFLIFFLDFLKAFFTLFFISYFSVHLFFMAALLLIGNAYSIFLRFKGGKGVATLLGILVFFDIKLFLIFICMWAMILFLAKRVDIASLCSCYLVTFLVYPVFLFETIQFFFFLLFVSLWITFRHRKNIVNLLYSKELRD